MGVGKALRKVSIYPENYCRHVIIAKIPFSVPDEPLEQSYSEWIEMQGKNAFMEVSVPDASTKLIQACGRLLRTEQDFGKISILDKRLLTKRYGKQLLNSLPPFCRKFLTSFRFVPIPFCGISIFNFLRSVKKIDSFSGDTFW